VIEIGLISAIILVLILPLTLHVIEKNLEIFLFIMGVLVVSISHFWGIEPAWSMHLIRESLVEPIMITLAVITIGFLVYFFRNKITNTVVNIERKIGSKLFCFVLIMVLGLLSSIITAIMAAIILVEIISALKLDKKYEIKLTVLSCFSIGLGAVLTPIGEPLSTITIAKLKGEPFNADFFFLFRELGLYVLPGILLLAIIGSIINPSVKKGENIKGLVEEKSSNIKEIFVYAGKVYIFIMALILLGSGFKPIVDMYIIKFPTTLLYWINSLSAVLDNATLAAAEISPKMNLPQIKYILIGFLISGGMLIPGNIPNIISAGRLKITSWEWAKIGLPIGFVFMVVYFIVFSLIFS